VTPNRGAQNTLYILGISFGIVIREMITMMSEMDANRPVYGAYEGQQRSSAQPIPPYEMSYQQPSPGGAIDDNFVEAVSQRIAQQMAHQQPGGKVYGQKRPSELPVGLRGAIAIVSVAVMVPIAIPLGIAGGFFGLVALGFAAAVILGVNAIANGVLSPRD
jgi:hypothetical protein